MALLAGRRDIAEIARFAFTLTPTQGNQLGLPRKRGTEDFYQAPGYDVLYQVLTRLELFFRWIKKHLRLRGFYSTSFNGVRVQIRSAISVYLLVASAKRRLNL